MTPEPWWIDLALVAILVGYIYDGIRRGFFLVALEVCGFIFSFVVALLAYPFVGKLIGAVREMPTSFSNAIAFFAVWFLIGILFPILAKIIYKKIPQQCLQHPLNRWFGFLPAIFDAILLAAVILPLIVSLPLPSPIKSAVLHSKLGAPIVRAANRIDRSMEGVISPAVKDGLAFLTIHPQSNQTVALNFKAKATSVDEVSETEMFRLVNDERRKVGLPNLIYSGPLRDAARVYGEEMVRNGYFSHYSRDGKSPADRATQVGIDFLVLGENLAFAPDVAIAHDGLMNSPGHRANILSKDFNRLGIGVIDAGIFGKIFVQEFTD